MPIAIGGTLIDNIKLGTTQIQKVYQGTTLIWQNKVEKTYSHVPRLTQWNSMNSPSWDWYKLNSPKVSATYQGKWDQWGNNRGLMVMNLSSSGASVDWTELLDGVEDSDIKEIKITVKRMEPHGYYKDTPLFIYGTTQGSGWPTTGKTSAPPVSKTYFGSGNPLCSIAVSTQMTITINCQDGTARGNAGKNIVKDLRDGNIKSLMTRSPLDGDGTSRPDDMEKHYIRLDYAKIEIKVMQRP